MKITISAIGEKSFNEIIDFLQARWTINEINNFKLDILKFREHLNNRIITFPKYNSNISYALVGKRNVKIFFKVVSKKEVVIILFWANKKDPNLLKNLLK